jgi:2-polyprenyl-3-methyl-5-hydroxy-6-metoxy-1,4-benzoquinol methylase
MRDGNCEKCTYTLSQQSSFEESALPVVKPEFDWLFERMANKVGNGKMLDIGCQSAYMFTKFHAPQELLYGIDVTQGPLKLAAQNLKDANFCRADATQIPYQTNSFDYLFCTEVLEHVPNGEAVLQDCFRVLKPDGKAFFTVPNGKGVAGKYICAHVRFFSYKELINILEEAGFEIIIGKKYGLYIPFISSFSSMASYVSGKKLPFAGALWSLKMPECLSFIFYVECRKSGK